MFKSALCRLARRVALTLLVVGIAPARAGLGDDLRAGEEVYRDVCSGCHSPTSRKTEARGAPRLGNRNAWDERRRKGAATLYSSVLESPHGKKDDPNREQIKWRDGLSDEQVRTAIVFMLEQVD